MSDDTIASIDLIALMKQGGNQWMGTLIKVGRDKCLDLLPTPFIVS